MDTSAGLGRALGHVRNAANAFWDAADPSGESLFLAADCLDVEGLFSELGVVPVVFDSDLGPLESLDRAAELLAAVRPAVPLAVWAAVQALRARATR